MNTEAVGKASALLGAGRSVQGESVDLSAGILLHKKTGDYCNPGDVIAVLHTSSIDKCEAAAEVLDNSIVFGERPPELLPEIFELVK